MKRDNEVEPIDIERIRYWLGSVNGPVGIPGLCQITGKKDAAVCAALAQMGDEVEEVKDWIWSPAPVYRLKRAEDKRTVLNLPRF